LQCYEPAYGQELEWILLDAIGRCLDRQHGLATYLRLTTRPVDQRPLARALARHGPAALRRQVLAGGYCLLDRADAPPSARPALGPDAPPVLIAAVGAVLPEAIAAADYLWEEGVAVTVLNLTSPRRLFEAWRAGGAEALAGLIPPEARRAPILTVQDGAAHSLAWLGSVYGAPVTPLGVDTFGQSGARADLYRRFGLDAASLIEAAFTAVDRLA
jgi:pyruvate dehydrogenase E1 component